MNGTVNTLTVLERHFTSVISALILGAVIWVGSSLTDSIDTAARTDVRLSNIEEDIGELKVELSARMRDRYTGSQAKQRQEAVDRQLESLTKSSRESERRIDRLEAS